jgi:hypothetical protein
MKRSRIDAHSRLVVNLVSQAGVHIPFRPALTG